MQRDNCRGCDKRLTEGDGMSFCESCKSEEIVHNPHCLAVAGIEQNDDLCSDGVDSIGNLLPCNPYVLRRYKVVMQEEK